jgi:hypothetical protein
MPQHSLCAVLLVTSAGHRVAYFIAALPASHGLIITQAWYDVPVPRAGPVAAVLASRDSDRDRFAGQGGPDDSTSSSGGLFTASYSQRDHDGRCFLYPAQAVQ